MKSMIYVCNLYSQVTLQKFRLIGVWGLSDFGCLGLRNLGRSVFGTAMTFGIERALSWLMFGYGCSVWDWEGIGSVDDTYLGGEEGVMGVIGGSIHDCSWVGLRVLEPTLWIEFGNYGGVAWLAGNNELDDSYNGGIYRWYGSS